MWYEEFAKDPNKIEEEFLASQGRDKEESERIRKRITEDILAGGHLTINEIEGFTNGTYSYNWDQKKHLNTCSHCQKLSDAISPQRINEEIDEILSNVDLESIGGSSQAGLLTNSSSRVSALFTSVALAFLTAVGGYVIGKNGDMEKKLFSVSEIQDISVKNSIASFSSVDGSVYRASMSKLNSLDNLPSDYSPGVTTLSDTGNLVVSSVALKQSLLDGRYVLKPCSTDKSDCPNPN